MLEIRGGTGVPSLEFTDVYLVRVLEIPLQKSGVFRLRARDWLGFRRKTRLADRSTPELGD